MKKIYAPILLVLSIAFFPSTSFGQILTPEHDIQGDSENNNVNIGPNSSPDARLRIEPLEEYGTLLLQTITGQPVQGLPGLPPPSASFSPFALRIENKSSGVPNLRVFNVTHTGQTIIGHFNSAVPNAYYLSSRDASGVFTNFSVANGFGSITQDATGNEQKIGWTSPNNAETPKFHIGYGLTNDDGFSEYQYDYLPQLTILKKEDDFSNIGINEENPSATLHVKYLSEEINQGESLNDHGILIENNGWRSHDYALRINSGRGDIFRFSNAGELYIGRDLNGDHPGNYKLYVEDGIRTEKIRVDIASENGWADYVFEEDYVLIPIDELEAFIKENKHLPGVPSAAVVVEEGIDLGEMNAILLRHIEELTLRMIDMQKEINELKNK